MNTGDKHGLWVLIEDEIAKTGSKKFAIKIWCSAHRSDLAFGDAEDEIPKAASLLNTLSLIASFYHTSAIRSAELAQIAKENDLTNMTKPKIFKVRWTEYQYRLARSILVSWNAMVLHLRNVEKEEKDKKASGFLKFLLKFEKLQMIAFLADLLFIYQRFQKKLQSNSLTLLSLRNDVQSTIASLESLKSECIPDLYEGALKRDIVVTADGKFLKGIKLEEEIDSRRPTQNFSEFRVEVCDSLIHCLKNRMEIDDELIEIMVPFVALEKKADLKRIHETIGKDLSLAEIYLQYSDLAAHDDIKKLSLHDKVAFLAAADKIDHFREMVILFARILACTPSSADVERCISANNILKTNLRRWASTRKTKTCLYTSIFPHWISGIREVQLNIGWRKSCVATTTILKQAKRLPSSSHISREFFRKQRTAMMKESLLLLRRNFHFNAISKKKAFLYTIYYICCI